LCDISKFPVIGCFEDILPHGIRFAIDKSDTGIYPGVISFIDDEYSIGIMDRVVSRRIDRRRTNFPDWCFGTGSQD
jgi:hypothetical protein